MNTILLEETLASNGVVFSARLIQKFRGQDKRSAAGYSVWLGFLRFFAPRFLEGCGAWRKLSNFFNASSAALYLTALSGMIRD